MCLVFGHIARLRARAGCQCNICFVVERPADCLILLHKAALRPQLSRD